MSEGSRRGEEGRGGKEGGLMFLRYESVNDFLLEKHIIFILSMYHP